MTKGEEERRDEEDELVGSRSVLMESEVAADEGMDRWGRPIGRLDAPGVTVVVECPEETDDEPSGFTGDIQRVGGREGR